MTGPPASAAARPPTAAPPADASPPRRGALLVIATATLLVVLDSTIVNVALPTVRARLGFSPAGLEWVVTAYSLAFGGLLLLGGRSGDLFGRRRMLVAGLTLFSLASLTAALAPDPAVLIAGLLLAAGGACWLAAEATPATGHAGLAGPLALFGLGLGLAVVPLTLTVLSGVQPADAGVASALVSASQQVGAAVGLATLGTIAAAVAGHQATAPASVLTSGYRAVFYVTAAVLATAFLITTATLPPPRHCHHRAGAASSLGPTPTADTQSGNRPGFRNRAGGHHR